MSRPITIDIPHKLGRAEARRRVEQGFEALVGQIGGVAKLHCSWSGDLMRFSAKALGQSISGRLDILDDAVKMEIDLPPLLAVIADRITGRLQRKGRLLLEDKKT